MALKIGLRAMLSLVMTGLFLFSGTIIAGCQTAPKTRKQYSATETNSAKVAGSIQPVPISNESNETVMVYYFHNNTRCPTCIKLESLTKVIVDSAFADALKSAKLEWKVVNFEEPGNEHFVNDYKLYAQSVVISVHKSGNEISWKNLDKIWTLIYDEPIYRDYIASQVRTALEGTHQ